MVVSEGFDCRLRLDQLRDGERIDLHADAAQCRRVADRLGLDSIERMTAHAVLERTGPAIRARGRLNATLTQSCVVTGEPLAAHIDEAFELLFRTEEGDARPDAEVELGESDCDVIFYDGAAIDLGDAIADTLALSLDPYPRSAGADAALKEAGILSEGEAGPFAALAALKGKLEG